VERVGVYIEYEDKQNNVSREIYCVADYVFLVNYDNHVNIFKWRNNIDHVRSVVNKTCERYAYLNELWNYIHPERNIKIDFFKFLNEKLTYEKLHINAPQLSGFHPDHIPRDRIVL